jgi:adenylate cyclase
MLASAQSPTRIQDRRRAAAASFLFADLCGFTAYTSLHGDELAADLAIEFQERVRELAAEEGCSVVKSIGDAVMVHSGDCRAAARLACRILALSEAEGFPPIRVGLDSGPAVRHGEDWYGSTVNAAARLTDAATPGELLMTESARSAVAPSASFTLVERGVQRLKGMPALALHAVIAS